MAGRPCIHSLARSEARGALFKILDPPLLAGTAVEDDSGGSHESSTSSRITRAGYREVSSIYSDSFQRRLQQASKRLLASCLAQGLRGIPVDKGSFVSRHQTLLQRQHGGAAVPKGWAPAEVQVERRLAARKPPRK